MKRALILTCALLVSFLLQSQEIIVSSGGEGIASAGSFSYSLGQVFYNSNVDSDGSMSQGVQQVVESSSMSNPQLGTVKLQAVTYPNPTSAYLILTITDPNLTNLSYRLANMQGKVLLQGFIDRSDTEISMQGQSSGVYVLRVNQKNIELKTFKIIKK